MSADVNVSFGATTGAFDAGINRIRSSLGSLQGSTNQLGGTFSRLASGFSGIFTGGSANALGSINAAMGGLAAGAQGAAAALGPVGIGIAAIGAVSVVTTGALLKMAEQFGDMAEKIDQTSQKLGMATADVMRFNAVGQMAGISNQSMSMSLVRLEKAMAAAASGSKKASGAFEQMGVDVKSVKNPTEAVLQIADKFKTMPDGPQKIALAMQTMGRAGSQLIPVLNGGSEALREQFKMAEEYGVVMDENFIQKGLAIDDAMDQMNMGMDGIRNTLYDSLAPAMLSTVEGINGLIKAFIQSYKEGGVVKTIMDGVAVTFDVLGQIGGEVFSVLMEVVSAFGNVFSEIFDQISSVFSAATGEFTGGISIWRIAINLLITPLRVLVVAIKNLATIAIGVAKGVGAVWLSLVDIFKSAMNLDFAGAYAAFGQLQSKLGKIAYDTGKGVVDNMIEGASGIKDLWSNTPKPPAFDAKPRATGDLDMEGAAKSGGASDKKKKADDAKKIAEAALKKEIEAINIKMEALKENYAEQMKLEEEKLVKLKAFYGEDSNEYKTELNKKAAMERAHQKELDSVAKEGIDHRTELNKIAADSEMDLGQISLDAERQRIETQAELNLISGAQKIQALNDIANQEYGLEVAHENKMYQLAVKALQDKLLLKSMEPAERDQINRQIEQLEAEHNARMKGMAANNNNANVQREQQLWMEKNRIQLGAINSLSQSWGNALAQMATGQASFADTVKALWQGIVGAVAQAIAQMIAGWIAQQLVAAILGKAIGGTTAASQIMANAGVAASGAYAATAMIPVVGPGLAPIAAATALAGTMAYLPLAFAAKGYDVPSGVNPLTQLHEEEMVLPKSLANPLRSMLAGPQSSGLADSAAAAGASASGGNGAMGGDVHYHDHTEKGMSPSQIVANRAALSKAIKMAHREGRFVGAKVLR